MTTAIFTEMESLRDGLTADLPGIEAKLTTFPSGSAMLDVRRANRAFVMAYTPKFGFGVDELHADDGFSNGYRYVFEHFEPAASQLRALAKLDSDIPSPALSLVVLQSGDLKAARDFYSTLGLSFIEEQHGKGPAHYSAKLGEIVLEIYPCQVGKPLTPARIGFRVPSLDSVLERLRSRGARIVREATDSPWGRRAVVEDPDGSRVELAANGHSSP
jgi:catechol 2,3-dioxygenase-like lactoylglutathione lyase family enzyme